MAAWIPHSLPTDDAVDGIAYGNSGYVVVGRGGRITTSTDGVTWTNRASGTTATLGQIAYGKGIFVTVGDWGTILTSADGVAWTSSVSGTSYRLNDLAYGNNEFVAVGDAGTILSSRDGKLWITHGAPTSNALNGVTFGNDTFVAVGNNGAILQSAPLTLPAMSPSLGGRFTSAGFELTVSGTSGQSISLQSADTLSANIDEEPRFVAEAVELRFECRQSSACASPVLPVPGEDWPGLVRQGRE